MPPEERDNKSLKQGWTHGDGSTSDKQLSSLFELDELDLYVNRVTLESYIFHRKDVNYDFIDHFEYDEGDHGIDVIMKDGRIIDLGAKVQWLIRPYFIKAKELTISQTRDGKVVKEQKLPFIHKPKQNIKK